jgi:hypothetical protein
MTPRTLFIITGDPRTSSRPAEAIRIAAGVGAWKKNEIRVYLHGTAALALGEFVDELVDADNFSRYLPIIGEWGRPVLVERGAACLKELGEASLKYQEITWAELADLSAQSTYLARF